MMLKPHNSGMSFQNDVVDVKKTGMLLGATIPMNVSNDNHLTSWYLASRN